MSEAIRVLVVDDEPLARRRLVRLLEGRAGIDLVGEAANGREAVAEIGRTDPDLVFLDIQMPDLDGFGVLAEVGPENMPLVVFVTAYDQYSLDAFEIAALDYLLKPFEDERFERALERALESLHQKRSGQLYERLSCLVAAERHRAAEISTAEEGKYQRRIAVEHRGRIYFVPVAEIEWIGSEGSYVRLHTVGASAEHSSHLVRDSLKRLESVLDPARFVRIHRSTIVQIDRVQELHPLFHGEYQVVLVGGATLKLSRSYRDRLDRLSG